mgnify:CR=1 FL=1
MRGVFRITRAEFNKIFKKPAVYIMAVVLVLACLISLFTFNPTNRNDERVTLSKENASTNYSLFMGTSGSENKTSYDKNVIEAQKIIDRYTQNTEFYSHCSSLNNKLNELYKLIDSGKATQEDITEYKKTVLEIIEFFNTDDPEVIKTYPKYLQDILNVHRIDADYGTNQIEETTTNYISEAQNKAKEIYNKIKNIKDVENLNNTIKSNSYMDKLNTVIEIYQRRISYPLTQLVNDIEKIDTIFKNYYSKQAGTTTPSSSKDKGKKILNMLKSKISEYKTITDEIVTKETNVALTTIEDKEKLDSIIKRVNEIIGVQILESDTNAKFVDIATKLTNDNYIKQLSAYNQLLTYVDYKDQAFTKKLNEINTQMQTNQTELLEKIASLQSDVSITRICESITSYKLMTITFNNLVNDVVTTHTVKNISESKTRKLFGYELESFNAYNLENNITYNTYYLKNNTFSNSFLNTFEYDKNIDYETSAYDYIYSALKICSLLIIVFTMMMAAYLISSEYDSGTIKLLLMRPYRRGKILSAKMLATLFFSLTFLLLSIVIAGVGGFVSFGLPAVNKVLVSFNSSSIFVTSPVVLLLIYIGTVVLDIIFFLILAFFIAIVFKSFAATLSASFISVLLTIVLNIALPTTIAYKFIPFTNISLFRFFGTNQTNTANLISTILATPINSQMTIWLSLIVTILFSGVLYTITSLVFKNRDY